MGSSLVVGLWGLGAAVVLAVEGSPADSAPIELRPMDGPPIAPGEARPGQAASLSPLRQGAEFYQSGNFTQAAQAWQQAIAQLAGQPLEQATAFTHLSLAQRQLGQWDAAQTALDRSFTLLHGVGSSASQQFALAKTFNAQGSLDLVTGHLNAALNSFQQAAVLYGQIGDSYGQFQSQMNQAKVLQSQGRNTLAQRQLETLAEAIQQSPNSPLKAATLRQLGEVVQLTSSLDEGGEWLRQSLAVAEAIDSNTERSATLLSLGLLAKNQLDPQQAISYYREAAQNSPSATVRLQALTSAFEIQIQQASRMQRDAVLDWSPAAMQQDIEQALAQAPPNRTVLFAQIQYAQVLLGSEIDNATPSQTAEILADAVQKARLVQDPQAESYGLGRLGQVYEQSERWAEAQSLTEQALAVAERANMPEIAYRWQWQLGRILKATGRLDEAEIAYQSAIDILQDLRGDLASLNPEARFSFREEIEPIYRQYVSLLLTPRSPTQAHAPVTPVAFEPQPAQMLAKTLDQAWKTLKLDNSAALPGALPTVFPPAKADPWLSQRVINQGEVSQAKLKQAREVIESLQVAELVNFFQADCVTVSATYADQIDPKAGVIYTILLEDRLEILLSQASAPIFHKSIDIAGDRVSFVASQLQRRLRRQEGGFRPLSEGLYDWLIRPIEAELADRDVETLVFVLDGELRNIPMAVLSDGEQYLLEKYALALTPGLQLFDPKPLQEKPLAAFIGALSEARQEFSPLPAVSTEVQTISQFLPTSLLINEQFQKEAVSKEITQDPTPIVHFATHGQFSSKAEDTFILTWDGTINIDEFSELLQGGFIGDDQAIELLVFSACETAAGDSRAALGLAGLAVRAGARSTLATLWQVDDEGTSKLMGQFYQNLATGQMTKAEAIRQAQITLLQTEGFDHPFYWSPFVLVGNWL